MLAEDRLWTSTLLGEALHDHFGIRPEREAVRLTLLALGYTWKRSRYAPGKTVDPAVLQQHKASLEMLKRGRKRAN